MSVDARKNFALSFIEVGPSPASSGKTLTLVAGGAALMPATPFNATCWPPGVAPLASNAEIVRVSNITGSVVTLSARAQEGTSAREIEAGWQFANMLTALSIEQLAEAIVAAQAAAEAAGAQGFAPTVVKNGAYTAAPGDYVPVDLSGGSVAIGLPAAPADKTRIGLKIVAISGTPGSTTLTVNRGGADVFNVAGGSTSLTLSAKFQGLVLQYKASTAIWYVQTTDTPLNEALGAALLGTDGTVGGPSGSALSASVVRSSQSSVKLPEYVVPPPSGSAATDTANLEEVIAKAIASGGVIRAQPGAYELARTLDFSAMQGTDYGVTFQGAGSGNYYGGKHRGATTILNASGGPALSAYGAQNASESHPIVSLRVGGLFIANTEPLGIVTNGSTETGKALITGIASTTKIKVGMMAVGGGIPPGAVVKEVNSATEVTLNVNATASATVSIVFQAWTVDIDNVEAGGNFDDLYLWGGGLIGCGFSFVNCGNGQSSVGNLTARNFSPEGSASIGTRFAAIVTNHVLSGHVPASGNIDVGAILACEVWKAHEIGTNTTGATSFYAARFGAIKAVNTSAWTPESFNTLGLDVQGQAQCCEFGASHSEAFATTYRISSHDCIFNGALAAGDAGTEITTPLELTNNASGNEVRGLSVKLATGGIKANEHAQGNIIWLEDAGTETALTDTSAEKTNALINLGSRNGSGTVKPSWALNGATLGVKELGIGGVPGVAAIPVIIKGTGTPEAAVSAPPGSVFLRTNGSTVTGAYLKASGEGNTGWTAVNRRNREEIRIIVGAGLVAENFNRLLCTGSTAAVSGTQYGYLCGFRAGDVVTGVQLLQATQLAVKSATGSFFKTALWKPNGQSKATLIANSVDMSAAMEAAKGVHGVYESAYTVTADEPLYVGFLYYAGAGGTPTAPTLAREGAATEALSLILANLQPGFTQTGQTEIGSVSALATTGGTSFWVGAEGTAV